MAFIPDPATSMAHEVNGIFWLIWWITFGIFVVVWAALGTALWKFRRRPGVEPRQFHSHLGVEIVWTVIPFVLLLIIAVPSYRVLSDMESAPAPALTVEIISHQFYWEYRYPEEGVTISYQPLRLPAHTFVRLLVSSADVIHSWSVPSFGFKQDAIPGRINDLWVRADKVGTYPGYCAQLCGVLHANMLTQVEVLPEADFQRWIQSQRGRTP